MNPKLPAQSLRGVVDRTMQSFKAHEVGVHAAIKSTDGHAYLFDPIHNLADLVITSRLAVVIQQITHLDVPLELRFLRPIGGLLAEAHGIINERNEALAQLGRQIQKTRVLVGVMNKVHRPLSRGPDG